MFVTFAIKCLIKRVPKLSTEKYKIYGLIITKKLFLKLLSLSLCFIGEYKKNQCV